MRFVHAHKQIVVDLGPLDRQRIRTIHTGISNVCVACHAFAHEVHDNLVATVLAIHEVHARTGNNLVVARFRSRTLSIGIKLFANPEVITKRQLVIDVFLDAGRICRSNGTIRQRFKPFLFAIRSKAFITVETIVPSSAINDIIASAAVNHIVVDTTINGVIAAVAIDKVVTDSAFNVICFAIMCTTVTEDKVVAIVARNVVGSASRSGIRYVYLFHGIKAQYCG